MRVILILLFSLLISTAHSQIVKFKAVKFVCTRYKNQPMEPPESKVLNGISVELNMDSSILYIYSPIVQVFHFDEKPISGSEKDSIISYSFNSVDKNTVRCVLTHKIYESEDAPYLAEIILEYADKTYMYYLQ